jgi:cardiolipin synthase
MTALPNLLTMSRIAAIPIIVVLLYFDGNFWRWSACGLFAVACITDFFDGYLARSRRQVSDLGRFLDPIADKLLVAAVLLVLAAERRVTGWSILPALIILCREILVSGLREYLAGLHVSVPVSQLAKWKTVLQMLALGFLILGDGGLPDWPVSLIGEIGLWAAAALTLLTGYDYLKAGLKHM